MGGISRCRKPVGPHTDNADCSDTIIAPLRPARVIASDLGDRTVCSLYCVSAAGILELVDGRLHKIDAEYVGQAHQIDGHVADLGTNAWPDFLVPYDRGRLLAE